MKVHGSRFHLVVKVCQGSKNDNEYRFGRPCFFSLNAFFVLRFISFYFPSVNHDNDNSNRSSDPLCPSIRIQINFHCRSVRSIDVSQISPASFYEFVNTGSSQPLENNVSPRPKWLVRPRSPDAWTFNHSVVKRGTVTRCN